MQRGTTGVPFHRRRTNDETVFVTVSAYNKRGRETRRDRPSRHERSRSPSFIAKHSTRRCRFLASLVTYRQSRSRLRPRYQAVSRVHLRARASPHWSRRIAALRKNQAVEEPLSISCESFLPLSAYNSRVYFWIDSLKYDRRMFCLCVDTVLAGDGEEGGGGGEHLTTRQYFLVFTVRGYWERKDLRKGERIFDRWR